MAAEDEVLASIFSSLERPASTQGELKTAFDSLCLHLKNLEKSGNFSALVPYTSRYFQAFARIAYAPEVSADTLQAGLKGLGYFMHQPDHTFRLEDEEKVLDLLLWIADQSEHVAVLPLVVWTLSVQQFSEQTMEGYLDRLLAMLGRAMAQSGKVEAEALQTLCRLLTQVPVGMGKRTDMWVEPVWMRLAHTRRKTRERALNALQLGRAMVKKLDPTRLKPLVITVHSSLAKKILQTAISSDPDDLRMGLAIVSELMEVVGPALTRLGIQDLLSVCEKAFKVDNPDICCCAFETWASVLGGFCSKQGIVKKARVARLLQTPLHHPLRPKQISDMSLMARAETWWRFICILDGVEDTLTVPANSDGSLDTPLVENLHLMPAFCLSANPGSPVWCYGLKALANILALEPVHVEPPQSSSQASVDWVPPCGLRHPLLANSTKRSEVDQWVLLHFNDWLLFIETAFDYLGTSAANESIPLDLISIFRSLIVWADRLLLQKSWSGETQSAYLQSLFLLAGRLVQKSHNTEAQYHLIAEILPLFSSTVAPSRLFSEALALGGHPVHNANDALLLLLQDCDIDPPGGDLGTVSCVPLGLYALLISLDAASASAHSTPSHVTPPCDVIATITDLANMAFSTGRPDSVVPGQPLTRTPFAHTSVIMGALTRQTALEGRAVCGILGRVWAAWTGPFQKYVHANSDINQRNGYDADFSATMAAVAFPAVLSARFPSQPLDPSMLQVWSDLFSSFVAVASVGSFPVPKGVSRLAHTVVNAVEVAPADTTGPGLVEYLAAAAKTATDTLQPPTAGPTSPGWLSLCSLCISKATQLTDTIPVDSSPQTDQALNAALDAIRQAIGHVSANQSNLCHVTKTLGKALATWVATCTPKEKHGSGVDVRTKTARGILSATMTPINRHLTQAKDADEVQQLLDGTEAFWPAACSGGGDEVRDMVAQWWHKTFARAVQTGRVSCPPRLRKVMDTLPKPQQPEGEPADVSKHIGSGGSDNDFEDSPVRLEDPGLLGRSPMKRPKSFLAKKNTTPGPKPKHTPSLPPSRATKRKLAQDSDDDSKVKYVSIQTPPKKRILTERQKELQREQKTTNLLPAMYNALDRSQDAMLTHADFETQLSMSLDAGPPIHAVPPEETADTTAVKLDADITMHAQPAPLRTRTAGQPSPPQPSAKMTPQPSTFEIREETTTVVSNLPEASRPVFSVPTPQVVAQTVIRSQTEPPTVGLLQRDSTVSLAAPGSTASLGVGASGPADLLRSKSDASNHQQELSECNDQSERRGSEVHEWQSGKVIADDNQPMNEENSENDLDIRSPEFDVVVKPVPSCGPSLNPAFSLSKAGSDTCVNQSNTSHSPISHSKKSVSNGVNHSIAVLVEGTQDEDEEMVYDEPPQLNVHTVVEKAANMQAGVGNVPANSNRVEESQLSEDGGNGPDSKSNERQAPARPSQNEPLSPSTEDTKSADEHINRNDVSDENSPSKVEVIETTFCEHENESGDQPGANAHVHSQTSNQNSPSRHLVTDSNDMNAAHEHIENARKASALVEKVEKEEGMGVAEGVLGVLRDVGDEIARLDKREIYKVLRALSRLNEVAADRLEELERLRN